VVVSLFSCTLIAHSTVLVDAVVVVTKVLVVVVAIVVGGKVVSIVSTVVVVVVVELEHPLRMAAIELRQKEHARKRIEGNYISMRANTCVSMNAHAGDRTCAWKHAQANKRTRIGTRTQTFVRHAHLYMNAS